MAYTNTGLVAHAKKALALDTKYMWGGILRPITNAYISQLSGIPAYKKQYPASRISTLKAVVGKGYYGVDCVGLIKSYYWSGNENGGTGSKCYGAAGYPDVNANGMYAAAKKKGVISTIPETAGIIVYCKSSPHVGVYIGNGEVIESTLSSRGDGVVKTKLSAFKWEYWFECPYISYETEEKPVPKPVATISVIKGAKLTLKNVGLYASITAKTPVRYLSGTYYAYDGVNRNGRIRICPTLANVGKTPTGYNVTGYINIADL